MVRTWVPLGAWGCLILLASMAGPGMLSASTRVTWEAVQTLGVVSGWRCANLATYVYDPRQDTGDPGLLAEAPQAVVRQTAPEVTVERVEVSLRGSDAVVWTTSSDAARRRVFVLSPTTKEAIGTPATRPATCYAHQAGWTVVAEQNLQ